MVRVEFVGSCDVLLSQVYAAVFDDYVRKNDCHRFARAESSGVDVERFIVKGDLPADMVDDVRASWWRLYNRQSFCSDDFVVIPQKSDGHSFFMELVRYAAGLRDRVLTQFGVAYDAQSPRQTARRGHGTIRVVLGVDLVSRVNGFSDTGMRVINVSRFGESPRIGGFTSEKVRDATVLASRQAPSILDYAMAHA